MGGSLCPVPSPGLRGPGPVGASETRELAEGPHMRWDLGEDGSLRPAESFTAQESPVIAHVMQDIPKGRRSPPPLTLRPYF